MFDASIDRASSALSRIAASQRERLRIAGCKPGPDRYSFPVRGEVVDCEECMRQASEKDDADLVLMHRVAADDQEAIAFLYDRFGSLIYRMAYQSMPTRADAEDAVQEIFVRLWKTAQRYDPKRAALVTWVMLISRRHLVDRLRRSQARRRASSLET